MLNVRTIKNRICGNRQAIMSQSGVMYVPTGMYKDMVSQGTVSNGRLIEKTGRDISNSKASIGKVRTFG